MFARSRTLKLLAATSAMAVLSACAASTEVQQAVAERHAEDAARPALAPAAAPQPGTTAIDVVPSTKAPATPSGATRSTTTSAAAAPAPAAVAAPAAPAAPRGTGTKKGKQAAAPVVAPAPAAASAAAPAPSGGCAAAAPPGGNGGATDTGVNATTIKIGGTFFNGGYLDKYGKVSENAPRAYFDYINDNGGICGRKIDYSTCDTAGTADGTTGCLTKLANQDQVFIMGPSLDFNLDIVEPTLAKDKLPWVGSSGLYSEEFASPWMFPTQPSGQMVGALITQYTATKLNAKKIGVSYLNDVAGPQCTQRAQQVATANGASVVKTVSNTEIETSLDSQVAALKNAGVDAVEFCNDPVNTVKFIQAAQRVGWKPIFVGGFVLADDVPKAAGSNGKGMYGFSFFNFYGSDDPGVKKYREITEYYYPQTFHHFYEQASYVGAEAIVAALRAVGPHLTREAFVKQMRSMTDFDSGLGLKLNFSNLSGDAVSGEMFQADDNLAWKPASQRFGLGGGGKSGAVAAPATAAVAPAAARNTAGRRRRRRP
ncbi:MAG TPA: ABC transporter substrate-binding protein [Sporichthyaceae bacterium]|nr:ABC transporter substrate-binding protein [Sporichthyaceae bacterium]